MSTQVNGRGLRSANNIRGLDKRGNPIYKTEGQEPDNKATRKD